MPAFGMKSVRDAENAWVEDEYSSLTRDEASSPSEASAPPRPPAPTPSPSSAPTVLSGSFLATGRFARRSVSAAAPAPAPHASASVEHAQASVVRAPALSNHVTAPVVHASGPTQSPYPSAPATTASKSVTPAAHRPSFAAARAAALQAGPDSHRDEDRDEDELGVMDENGQLIHVLDSRAPSDPDEDDEATAFIPRLFARQQLIARRMVQELGDVRRLPADELMALEQRAMRDPLAVVNEYRAAHQNEVRLQHIEGVRSLKEAIDLYPGETVFMLQAGGRRAIRHVARDGGVNDFLHGLLLDSVPGAATPFGDLSGLFSVSPSAPTVAALDEVAPASQAPAPAPEALAVQSAPAGPIVPEVVASAPEAASVGQSVTEVVSPSPKSSSPPAPAPVDAAAQRWSRKPRGG